MRRGGVIIEIKTPEQIAVMREAGLVVARTLRVLAEAVRPGITTADLDELAEAEIRAAGATGSFKGYHGYPATICTSVNEEIVHGIPSRPRSMPTCARRARPRCGEGSPRRGPAPGSVTSRTRWRPAWPPRAGTA